MTYRDSIRASAKKLALLDEVGELFQLDSLELVNLVVEVEKATGTTIPNDEVRPENFSSIDRIDRLLSRLTAER
jgi:acyl carrier protein